MVWFLIPIIGMAVAAGTAANIKEENRRRRERRDREEREERERLERTRRQLEEAQREQEELERKRQQRQREQREKERKQREEYERQERERSERLRREEEQRVRERQERERRQREEQERWQREKEAQRRRMEEEQRRKQEEQRREWERMEAQRERERLERERLAREEFERQQRQKEEAERREQARIAKEAEELRRKEEAARAEQKAREEEYAREQERLRVELEREKERERAESQRKHEDSLRKQEEEKVRKEAELKQQRQEQQSTQDKLKEHIQAQQDEENAKLIARGICPNLFPTEEQWKEAKARLVSEGKFHCAVAGVSGVGKSSLVNGLRGISNKDPKAAEIGVVETTIKVTAYPDAAPSRSDWVWYDVPGAGTLTVPAPQYFNSYGLFAFDLILVVIDTRFTAQDIAILHQCRQFQIPSFIVRSKANQQITNIMHQTLGYSGDDDDEGDNEDTDNTQTRAEMIAKAKEIRIQNTKENVQSNLREAEFDTSQRAYVVSARNVRLVVTGTKGNNLGSASFMIDEEELIRDLHRVVAERSVE